MRNKIIFTIMVSFCISILIISLIDLTYPKPDIVAGVDNEFYSKKFDPKKERVFIIGSSNIGQLNTTLVNEIVSNNYPAFDVYNLAITSDFPSTRLPHLEKTIALKPKLIIYGITYRDFVMCGFNANEICDTEKNHFLLPRMLDFLELVAHSTVPLIH